MKVLLLLVAFAAVSSAMPVAEEKPEVPAVLADAAPKLKEADIKPEDVKKPAEEPKEEEKKPEIEPKSAVVEPKPSNDASSTDEKKAKEVISEDKKEEKPEDKPVEIKPELKSVITNVEDKAQVVAAKVEQIPNKPTAEAIDVKSLKSDAALADDIVDPVGINPTKDEIPAPALKSVDVIESKKDEPAPEQPEIKSAIPEPAVAKVPIAPVEAAPAAAPALASVSAEPSAPSAIPEGKSSEEVSAENLRVLRGTVDDKPEKAKEENLAPIPEPLKEEEQPKKEEEKKEESKKLSEVPALKAAIVEKKPEEELKSTAPAVSVPVEPVKEALPSIGGEKDKAQGDAPVPLNSSEENKSESIEKSSEESSEEKP